jgi:hypothetical protein
MAGIIMPNGKSPIGEKSHTSPDLNGRAASGEHDQWFRTGKKEAEEKREGVL